MRTPFDCHGAERWQKSAAKRRRPAKMPPASILPEEPFLLKEKLAEEVG